MPATPTLASRVATLEADGLSAHHALLEQSVSIGVLEATMEAGFASLERRFDALQTWLAERL